MVSSRAFPFLGVVALVAGVVATIFICRLPMRGWISVTLVLLASAFWALIEAGSSSSITMFMLFLFTAPIAVVYPFRARRLAPDRVPALAAFVGSFIIAAFLLFMVFGIVYSFFLL